MVPGSVNFTGKRDNAGHKKTTVNKLVIIVLRKKSKQPCYSLAIPCPSRVLEHFGHRGMQWTFRPGQFVHNFVPDLWGSMVAHNQNMPMQYTAIFIAVKNDNFQSNYFDYFHIFAQNIYCGYRLEPPN